LRIGPITVQWTKAVAEQAAKQEHDNTLRLAVIEQLTAQNIAAEALLRRWGLDNGVFGQGGGVSGVDAPQGVPGV
jgi:hypothetical protein